NRRQLDSFIVLSQETTFTPNLCKRIDIPTAIDHAWTVPINRELDNAHNRLDICTHHHCYCHRRSVHAAQDGEQDADRRGADEKDQGTSGGTRGPGARRGSLIGSNAPAACSCNLETPRMRLLFTAVTGATPHAQFTASPAAEGWPGR